MKQGTRTASFSNITLPSTDLAGNPRIAYGRIDMGAYEFKDTTFVGAPYGYRPQENILSVYPNPFTQNAFISFSTARQSGIRLTIYTLAGQPVRKLMDTDTAPGNFSITWDGTDSFGFQVQPGTYLATLEINGRKAGSVKVVKKS